MRRVVLPAISDVSGSVIDIDVAVAPVAAAAPVIAPAPDRPARTEGQPGRDDAGADIGRITKVVRRIVRVGPSSIDSRRLVVRHVHRPRLGRLDDDHLLVFLGLNSDFLLLRRDELLVVISLGAQPLDRIHHVRLLREEGVTQILGPFELVAHHGQNLGGAGQRLDAVVPGLLVDLLLQCIALQRLALLQPAVGLYHLQRIGRRRQHVGEQFVGIERDRRNQGFELLGLQRLCVRRGLARRLRLRCGRLVGRLCRHGDGHRHHESERDQSLAAAEHHTLLWGHRGKHRYEARSFFDKDQRKPNITALLRRKSSAAACVTPK